jgi:predicted phosphodiesterase
MKIVVISDIHANANALEAVLAAAETEAPDEVWCLGDTVGYGPEPNRCCTLVAERAALCLAGNHDLAVIGTISVAEFNGDAAAAVRWTQGVLDERSLAFLRGLSPTAVRAGVECFHGSPLDPVWDYVLTEATARRSFEATLSPLVLVGHSHLPLVLTFDGVRIAGGPAPGDARVALAGARHLLNPGSVGQPRGRDPRASWMLLDLDQQTAEFRRTPYDIVATQAAIRAQGLPSALAARLALGE